MRFPYRAPRCAHENTVARRRGWSTTHVCGLRDGHKGPHACRKHTCGHQW